MVISVFRTNLLWTILLIRSNNISALNSNNFQSSFHVEAPFEKLISQLISKRHKFIVDKVVDVNWLLENVRIICRLLCFFNRFQNLCKKILLKFACWLEASNIYSLTMIIYQISVQDVIFSSLIVPQLQPLLVVACQYRWNIRSTRD